MTERPDDFTDELKQAVRNLPSPEPTGALLARILESRAKGHRVELPAASRRRRLPAVIGIAAAAAAAAAVVLWIAAGPRHESSKSQAAASQNSALEEFAAGMSLWPNELYAQASTSSQLPPIPPRNGSLLKGGQWVYAVQTLDEDGRVIREYPSTASVWITKGSYQDSVAWLYMRQRESANPAGLVDTVWLSRDSLHPLARFSQLMYGASLTSTYTGDSIVEIWRKPGGEVEHKAAALPSPRLWDRAVVLVWNELPTLFLTTPLNAQWQGSYAGTTVNNAMELVTFWWDLRVVGAERITVPAGTFDCWKVALLYGQDPSYVYWVDKTTGWTIRESLVPHARVARVLVSHAAN